MLELRSFVECSWMSYVCHFLRAEYLFVYTFVVDPFLYISVGTFYKSFLCIAVATFIFISVMLA